MMNPSQAQYRAHAQMAQRAPHASSSRRGMVPMLSGPNMHPGANQAQLHQHRVLAEVQRADIEMAKRKAKKPTDKNLPEGVEDLVVGDGVQQYRALRDVERRLDAVMMRKRLDLNEARTQLAERTRRLRLWVSNTAENQPWQGRGLDENAFDFSTGQESTYKVRIEGRLLDEENGLDEEEEGEEGEEEAEKEKDKRQAEQESEPNADAMETDGAAPTARTAAVVAKRPRFSSFFKAIVVEYDRPKNLQPDATTSIEWKKPVMPPQAGTDLPAAVDFDFLEFERKSDENINCTILLYRDEAPPRWAVSRALADVIGEEEATRETILIRIWEYIKAMGLQQDDEKRRFHCDEALRKVFGVEVCAFPNVNELIIAHIQPIPPIRLPYTIRVDPEYQAHCTPIIYDIAVPGESAVHQRWMAMRADPAYPAMLQQTLNLDGQLALVVQAAQHSKSKHAFFTGLSKDPVAFIKKWTSSQRYDLDVIVGELPRGSGEVLEEEFRRGGKDGVWGSENVRESVTLLAAKPLSFGR